MEKPERGNLTHVVLALPGTLLRLLGRIIKALLIALGVLVVLSWVGYLGFESIVEALDSRYSDRIDTYLGIDGDAISRLQ